MINAKEELCNHINEDAMMRIPEAIFIDLKGKQYLFKPNDGLEGFEIFLEEIDIDYNDGYGGQELYGTIWYRDGTWSERGEYDGAEWWEFKKCPPYPKELLV